MAGCLKVVREMVPKLRFPNRKCRNVTWTQNADLGHPGRISRGLDCGCWASQTEFPRIGLRTLGLPGGISEDWTSPGRPVRLLFSDFETGPKSIEVLLQILHTRPYSCRLGPKMRMLRPPGGNPEDWTSLGRPIRLLFSGLETVLKSSRFLL